MTRVTVIPATRDFHTGIDKSVFHKRRVAPYARVSTGSEEQLTSYEAQVDYYTKYVQSRPDWELVKVYTDRAISGTNTKHREGFNEMISDALDGKIDLIVTKSVSRFARNTVDALVTIRKLKEKGIEVYFEKENIFTLDSKGELLLTIMSSLAQDESRSISDNITWGQRKRFADGKVSMPYKHFLGYKKGEDELPEIVPEEAEIVRMIFRMYLEGKTSYAIAAFLTEQGIPTPSQKTSVWQASTIDSMLQNEKYRGSALLQKTFTVDFLQKKMKVNEGEVPQYYIEESHPAIISPAEFEIVQSEIAHRKKLGKNYSGNTIFATKVICGDCGGFYGPKVWHSTDKYRKVIYRCNNKYDSKKCTSPTITEDEIKDGFLQAFNSLLVNKAELLEDLREMQSLLSDTSAIDDEIKEQNAELEIVTGLLKKCVDENKQQEQDQDKFWEKYNSLDERYKKSFARITELMEIKKERCHKAEIIGAFMFELYERDEPLTEFDTKLWVVAIENVTVYHDGKKIYKFKNGLEITI